MYYELALWLIVMSLCDSILYQKKEEEEEKKKEGRHR
jgi:hypothetical protein